jgi:ubiquitin carboxyl-terminal hydrolase L5
VFTELISTFGVKGVQVEELYSLDEETFQQNAPIYGLIFLFKYKSENDPRPTIPSEHEPKLFFAKQVISDACATQAILSILLNVPEDKIDLGPTLTEFKAFTSEFSDELKGMAIGNSGPIRDSHNSFARAEPFVMDQEKRVATEKDDVFHFIAYVPHQGRVFELDGLKPGPILLGDIKDGETGDWLTVARPAIQARIEKYASSEIRFNLMGVVKNKKEVLTEQMNVLDARLAAIQVALSLPEDSEEAAEMEVEGDWSLGKGKDALNAQLVETETAIKDCKRKLSEEDEKFAGWKMENIRRKHNYIPFVVKLLRILAERDLLNPMVEKAKNKTDTAAAATESK